MQELQERYLELRWESICAREESSNYLRDVDLSVADELEPVAGVGDPSVGARRNLPSFAATKSPAISSSALLLDAATCGLWYRRRKVVCILEEVARIYDAYASCSLQADFGDGMIEYDVDQGKGGACA